MLHRGEFLCHSLQWFCYDDYLPTSDQSDKNIWCLQSPRTKICYLWFSGSHYNLPVKQVLTLVVFPRKGKQCDKPALTPALSIPMPQLRECSFRAICLCENSCLALSVFIKQSTEQSSGSNEGDFASRINIVQSSQGHWGWVATRVELPVGDKHSSSISLTGLWGPKDLSE